MLKLEPTNQSIISEDVLGRLPEQGSLYKWYRVGDSILAWSESTNSYFAVNGAPGGSIPQANFLTLAAHAGLDNERVFTPGENTQSSDGGAGGNYNLSVKIGALIPNSVNFSTDGKSNNINPAGWNDTWVSSTGSGKATNINYIGASWAIISGITGGSEGRICIFTNKSNHLVIIENDSTNSTSANRIKTNDGIALFIGPDRSVMLQHQEGFWRVLSANLWTGFDDFEQLALTLTSGGPLKYHHAINVGSTASAQTANQMGIISSAPASGARGAIYSMIGGGYTPSAGDPSYPIICVNKIYLSASPGVNSRVAIGIGNFIGGATAFYSSVANGALFAASWDSTVPNASTNWSIFSGSSGSIGAFAAGAIDSGVPISQCVNAWNVFVVYFDYKNNVYMFFHSPDLMTYNYVGLRTARPTSGTIGFWHEAVTASRPTMWCDYSGFIQKIVTRR
jgi:hypothetical protein